MGRIAVARPGRLLLGRLLFGLLLPWWLSPAVADAGDTARSAAELHEQAATLVDQGHYAQALERARQSLELRRTAHGPGSAEAAAGTQQVAMVRYHSGDLDGALVGLREALAIVRGLGEPAPAAPALGVTRDLVWVLMESGRVDEVPALLEPAVARAVAELGEGHETTADLLNHQATWLQRKGRLEDALPVQARSLALRERQHGARHWSVGQSLNNLAIIQLDLGDYEAALGQLHRASRLFEAYFGPRHPELANVLSTLASAYWDLGRLGEALPAAQRALEIDLAADGSRHAAIAQSQSLVSILLRDLGRAQESLALQQQARERLERAGLQSDRYYGVVLNHLGVAHTMLGNLDAAVQALQQALEVKRRVVGPAAPTVGVSLRALGALHLQAGRLDQASAAYTEALQVSQSALGAGHASVAASLDGLAEVDLRRGRVDEALARLGKAERIACAAGVPALQWKVQDRLRVAWARAGRPLLAAFWGKQAVATLQAMRAGLVRLNGSLQESFVADKRPVYTELAQLLIDAGRLEEARQVMALLKDEELHDFLRRGGPDTVGPARSVSVGEVERQAHDARVALQQRFDRARLELAKWRRLSASGDAMAKGRLAEVGAELEAAERDYDALIGGLPRRFGAGPHAPAAGTPPVAAPPPGHPPVRQLAPPTAMIHYVLGASRLSILLTTPDGQLARESAVGAFDIHRQVGLLRAAIQSRREVLEPARQLYRWLLEPVEGELRRAGITHLALSLDGALRYFPFAALHDGRQWAAERYSISVLTEAGGVDLDRPSSPQWRLAGLGLTRAVAGFEALPAVIDEFDAIRGRVLPGEVWLDERFTSGRLQQALAEGAPVLHIASHFEFRPGTESESFLLLGDGQRMTLKDIRERRLPFTHLDLLTLSACDTAMGGGLDETGVEVEGFGALAQRQGARAVLATLWPVADSGTARYMEAFYSARQQGGMDKARALQAAQKALMAQRRWAHPYYWAPFILMGNWR